MNRGWEGPAGGNLAAGTQLPCLGKWDLGLMKGLRPGEKMKNKGFFVVVCLGICLVLV